MSKVSKLFDTVSKEYNQIYKESNSKKLLNQEKKIRANIAEKFVIDYLSPDKDQIILDVGCGIGNVLLNLRKKGVKEKLFGFDVSEGMINKAIKKLKVTEYKDIEFICGELKDININANILLSLGVIGYQKKQEDFLVELSNHVINKGYLIFTIANGDSILRLLRNYLSKLHSIIFQKKKREGVNFLTMKDKQVKNILTKSGLFLEKKVYITFGLGLFSSSIECFIDRFLQRYFRNNFIGKFFSLTVIYVYKRNE